MSEPKSHKSNKPQTTGKVFRIPIEEFRSIVRSSISISEIGTKCGYSRHNGDKPVRIRIAMEGIDDSHLKTESIIKRHISEVSDDQLREVYDKSLSLVDLFRMLGYSKINQAARNAVVRRYIGIGIDIGIPPDRWRDYTKYGGIATIHRDILKEVVDQCCSFAQVLACLGYKGEGRMPYLRHRLIQDNIPYEHLKSWGRGRKGRLGCTSHKAVPYSEILIENSKSNASNIKRRLLRDGILKNECSECGNAGSWNGRVLCMVMDHINGINNDNRLENLRMLCPNCNSQTDTFCGSNMARSRGLYDIVDELVRPGNRQRKHSKSIKSMINTGELGTTNVEVTQ